MLKNCFQSSVNAQFLSFDSYLTGMEMETYVSLLRGINVGGQRKINMKNLHASYMKIGLTNIMSYLQSGNVLFSCDTEKTDVSAEIITQQIFTDFGFQVPVILINMVDYGRIIRQNPFQKDSDPAFLHVTFLANGPKPFDPEILSAAKKGDEALFIAQDAVYLYCPDGYGNTGLNNNFLENKLKRTATTRNWRTCLEILKLAGTSFNFNNS
jgi:uncharacterized protein (DUF1697 family)